MQPPLQQPPVYYYPNGPGYQQHSGRGPYQAAPRYGAYAPPAYPTASHGPAGQQHPHFFPPPQQHHAGGGGPRRGLPTPPDDDTSDGGRSCCILVLVLTIVFFVTAFTTVVILVFACDCCDEDKNLPPLQSHKRSNIERRLSKAGYSFAKQLTPGTIGEVSMWENSSEKSQVVLKVLKEDGKPNHFGLYPETAATKLLEDRIDKHTQQAKGFQIAEWKGGSLDYNSQITRYVGGTVDLKDVDGKWAFGKVKCEAGGAGPGLSCEVGESMDPADITYRLTRNAATAQLGKQSPIAAHKGLFFGVLAKNLVEMYLALLTQGETFLPDMHARNLLVDANLRPVMIDNVPMLDFSSEKTLDESSFVSLFSGMFAKNIMAGK